jgi:hypothetical protein
MSEPTDDGTVLRPPGPGGTAHSMSEAPMSEATPPAGAVIPGPEPAESPGSIGRGIGLLLLLHLVQLVLLPVGGVFYIGLSQLLYVVPAAIVLARRGRSQTHKGLWIGAGITFLLNATCFGVILVSLSSADFR